MQIKDLPQFKQDCQRFQRVIASVADPEKKTTLHNMYKDFILKASNIDQSMEDFSMGFGGPGIDHKDMIEEFKKIRLAIERYITSLNS